MDWSCFLFLVIVPIVILVSADVTNVTLVPNFASTDGPLLSFITPDRPFITSRSTDYKDMGTWFTDGHHFLSEIPNSSSFDETPLFLLAMFPLNGDGWNVSGLFVTADLALKHVNDNPDILPGYRLFMVPVDSKCNDGVAIQKFFEKLYQPPRKVVVIGPGCSLSTQPIASTAQYWNLNVTMADLLTRFKQSNISIITSESFDETPANQLENLKKQDAKIIFASMYERDARKMLCEIYKLGMYGEGYVWILPGWYTSDWYKVEDDGMECTVDEITFILGSSNYFGVQERVLADVDTKTVTGITRGQYDTQLYDLFQQEKYASYNLIPDAHYGYDTIWAVALALHKTAEYFKQKGFNNDGRRRGLENFSYSDEEMGDKISEALEAVNFTGISGPVNFHQGERIRSANIKQLQAQCEDRWQIHSNYCYLFVASQKSWEEASNYCKDEGSFLVSILSKDENEALIELGQKEIDEGIHQWWISLTDAEGDGLLWSGREELELDWSPWKQESLEEKNADNKPDEQKNDSNTLVLNLKTCYTLDVVLKTWLPVNCSDTLYCFICKKTADYEQVVLATYNVDSEDIEWIREIIWPGGVIPLDHTPVVHPRIEEIYQGISVVIFVVTCSVSVLGGFFATVCLIFNLKYREKRLIMMSSPNVNNLIIIGCILVYASACTAGLEGLSVNQTIFLKFYQMRLWSFSIGFVLSFGSMFSKTWRVHKLSALKNTRRTVVTDRNIFVMVGMMLCLDVIVLSAWFIISPVRVEKTLLTSMEDVDNMVIFQPYIQYCTSDYEEYWLGALYSYKILLLIFGVFLAWETRKVTITAVNDSKLIGLCVYNVVLLSVIGVGVRLVLTADPSMSFMFTSGIQIFGTSVILVIMFVPKMVSIIQYPEGKPVTNIKSRNDTSVGTSDSVDDCTELRTEVEQLRSQLEELQRGCHRCQQSGCGFWCRSAVYGWCGGTYPKPDQNSVVDQSSLQTQSSYSHTTEESNKM